MLGSYLCTDLKATKLQLAWTLVRASNWRNYSSRKLPAIRSDNKDDVDPKAATRGRLQERGRVEKHWSQRLMLELWHVTIKSSGRSAVSRCLVSLWGATTANWAWVATTLPSSTPLFLFLSRPRFARKVGDSRNQRETGKNPTVSGDYHWISHPARPGTGPRTRELLIDVWTLGEFRGTRRVLLDCQRPEDFAERTCTSRISRIWEILE